MKLAPRRKPGPRVLHSNSCECGSQFRCGWVWECSALANVCLTVSRVHRLSCPAQGMAKIGKKVAKRPRADKRKGKKQDQRAIGACPRPLGSQLGKHGVQPPASSYFSVVCLVQIVPEP